MAFAKSFIKEGSIEPRLYQETILDTAVNKNTLVVLPTGLGKTVIAALVAAKRLELNMVEGKILFLAPTKPLVEQHAGSWKDIFKFPKEEFKVFTGLVNPQKRISEYDEARFIFATPQVIQNDVLANRFSMEHVVLLIVDEAHRTTGEYPYEFIARKYFEQANEKRLLALTASPGTSREEIETVCKALRIENIENRSREDTDVSPYVKERNHEWVMLELPREMLRIKGLLGIVFAENLRYLKNAGIIQTAEKTDLRKKEILRLQAQLVREAHKNKDLYPYLSATAALLKLHHAIEMVETQGVKQVYSYLKGLHQDTTKAALNLLTRTQVKEATDIAEELVNKGIEHPKVQKLVEFLKENKKTIVFAHYRATVEIILSELAKNKIKATSLVGQVSKGNLAGLSQKEQLKRLNEFRKGKYRVLVATSVGEEGLDIPEVDQVIFYEPIPSAVRTIQRMGRTARHKPGKIVVFITKGTRDEAYYWTSFYKEKKMQKVLKEMDMKKIGVAQGTLDKFQKTEKGEQKAVVFADVRESGSGILRELDGLGIEVRMKQLDIADFQLSDRVGVERKTCEDFLQSLIDGRLLAQAKNLVENFRKPLFIVEGESLYGLRNIHPNAIKGALVAIKIDFGIPIIYTKDAKETSEFLATIAKREQLDKKREIVLREGKRVMSLPEMQQFVVESLPMVGPGLAKKLLEYFGCVEAVFKASEAELQKVENVGEIKAKEMRKIIASKFESIV
ncbi:TPA: DEAD/DEAH box helicase family protein [archaeon]|nr:DEAD/DEAH box helicase family protein [Candidatus Naiadarchaeales archaeon SRR2090159.bin1288]